MKETIKTSEGTFECNVIELKELLPFSKEKLGERPTGSDYETLIRENTLVYLDGKRVAAFLKGALTTVKNIEPGTDSYSYWKWVSRDLHSDQRGIVGGKELSGEVVARLSLGQQAFFRAAEKGKINTLEEAREVLSKHSGFSRNNLYIKKILESGLVNKDRILELESFLRKKSTPEDVKSAALAERNELRLEWFENWLPSWVLSDDKVAYAKQSFKNFVSLQSRANAVYSNVLGFMDRSARIPYGRYSSSTQKKEKEFIEHKDFYQQASNLYRDTLPEEWEYIHSVMKECKDDRYTLMGTKTFSTITVNYNFPTYFHYDGKNNPRGVAVLTALTNETTEGEKYDGSYFVMPQLGLAFDIRKGDFFVGDNCNLAHGQTEQMNKTDDAENIVFVFYARDGMSKLENFEFECCRKDFIAYSQTAYEDRYRKNDGGKFTGVFPSMWVSDEWDEYRKNHCPNASRTNYHYTEN